MAISATKGGFVGSSNSEIVGISLAEQKAVAEPRRKRVRRETTDNLILRANKQIATNRSETSRVSSDAEDYHWFTSDTDLESTTASPPSANYINTIPASLQPLYPGDVYLERRIQSYIAWNAAAMVIRANKKSPGIGGHLSTYASASTLYEVGFNWFFKGKDSGTPGDAVYFQGHVSPGIYARAFLEGRLTSQHLDSYRFESSGGGLSSYPHPRLMPQFWEYPTVSMGLGPLNSIHHAKFLRYLTNRKIDDLSNSRVWAFLGDGECSEPEVIGSITTAAQHNLANLTWVVNCNLQSLDGPVRGNGKLIQDLEATFKGAGWNVIKVVWGGGWDDLLRQDVDGLLLDKMNTTCDGAFQRYASETGGYFRKHFFGTDKRLLKLVEHLSDRDLKRLQRGGHDFTKVYSAYKAAVEETQAPTVILAKTVKGCQLGDGIESRDTTHNVRNMNTTQLLELRDNLGLQDEISYKDLDSGIPPYLTFPRESTEHDYIIQRRRQLGGSLPKRVVGTRKRLAPPSDQPFELPKLGFGDFEVSTTKAYSCILRDLMREHEFGNRIVPIVPDEARAFGIDSMFKEFKMYSPIEQQFEPIDHGKASSYYAEPNGQILQEGINEAGATSSWIAAATSYATTGIPMVPFYTFYSMFGFQRVGDLIWSAADSKARGFLIGATAGRTTLAGEGLQHQDGQSLSMAANVPNCQTYDPSFAYEVAAIIKDGIKRMYIDDEDIFYYMTLYGEDYLHPSQPANIEDGIVQGLYKWAEAPDGLEQEAKILFSGSAHTAAREAQRELAGKWNVGTELWSATSYKRIREEALESERWSRLNPDKPKKIPWVTKQLGSSSPVIAVSDFVRSVPEQIARFTPGKFTALGTDGFGRSDDRKALRNFFEVDTANVVISVLTELSDSGRFDRNLLCEAVRHYDFDPSRDSPWSQ